MPEILKIDPALEERQRRKVAGVRAERSQAATTKAIDRVEATARDGLVTAEHDHRAGPHVLLFAHDLWHALTAEVRECLGRMLQ